MSIGIRPEYISLSKSCGISGSDSIKYANLRVSLKQDIPRQLTSSRIAVKAVVGGIDGLSGLYLTPEQLSGEAAASSDIAETSCIAESKEHG